MRRTQKCIEREIGRGIQKGKEKEKKKMKNKRKQKTAEHLTCEKVCVRIWLYLKPIYTHFYWTAAPLSGNKLHFVCL